MPSALQIWSEFIAKVYPGEMTAEQTLKAQQLRMAFFAGALVVQQVEVRDSTVFRHRPFQAFAAEIKAEAAKLGASTDETHTE